MTATMTAARGALLLLFALLVVLAGVAGAAAAPAVRFAGLEAAIHGAAQLELSSCVYPAEDGGALFLAFVDNPSDEPAQAFTVTLHNGAALLAERTYGALQPGDSKVFATWLDAAHVPARGHAGVTSCAATS